MPSRSARARAAIRTSLVGLSIVLIVPVCATLWLGGADWTLSDSVRLSWYDEPIVWPLLAALIGWLLVAVWRAPAERPRAGDPSPQLGVEPTLRIARLARLADGLAASGLLLTFLAVGILWSGGFRLPFLSLRSPALSAWGAIVLFGVAAFLSARLPSPPSRRPRWTAFAAVLLPLCLGLLLQDGLASLDLRSMTRAMEETQSVGESTQRAAAKPDVLWIVVDTLRADALGVYGAKARTGAGRTGGTGAATILPASPTPFLDSLAERGVLFERALAPAPWTVPSMFSAFTALWPSSLDPEGRGRARRADERIGLGHAVPTWIDVLRENGYHAAAFQKNPFLGEGSGLETRFDLYRIVGGDRAEGESAGQLVNAALRWGNAMRVHREGAAAPYLLYLHFMDPHIDYAPPPDWVPEEATRAPGTIDGRARTLHRRLKEGPAITVEERIQLARLYAAEVAYLDAELARLWSGLEDRMLVDSDTLVVVTGDHGEQFGEHGGWEHGDLFSENLHVPFMMAGAGLGLALGAESESEPESELGAKSEPSPRRVSEAVSLLDLGPTLLERLGLRALEGAEGQSLLGARVEGDRVLTRPVFSEYGARARVESGRWILIEGRENGRDHTGALSVTLYDRVMDPDEQTDLATLRPEIAGRLREQLAAHRARTGTRDPAAGGRVRALSGDRRLEQELEALGYGDSPE